MNGWIFPIFPVVQPRPVPKCTIFGRVIEAPDKIGHSERVCRACLGSAPEKRAA